MSAPPIEALGLLPHAGAARLLTRVVACGAEEIRCEGSVPEDSPYAREGRCPTFVALELAAQAAALLEALAEAAARPRQGYLVRARNLRVLRSDFAAGARLVASVRRVGAQVPLYVYEIDVQDDLGPLLAGQIATYAAD